MSIPIHYIEIKKNEQNKPEELIILPFGADVPTRVSLRQSSQREADITGASRRASINPQTGSLLEIAGKFI